MRSDEVSSAYRNCRGLWCKLCPDVFGVEGKKKKHIFLSKALDKILHEVQFQGWIQNHYLKVNLTTKFQIFIPTV